MSLIQMTIKHGRSLAEAREILERSISQACNQFGGMIHRVQWSEDRNQVTLSGAGCNAEIRVDPIEVHVHGDIPILARLLGAPILNGFKQLLKQNFEKLPPPKP
jgi:hypothetical protein